VEKREQFGDKQTRNDNHNQRKNRVENDADNNWREEVRKKYAELQEVTAKYVAVCKDLDRFKCLDPVYTTTKLCLKN